MSILSWMRDKVAEHRPPAHVKAIERKVPDRTHDDPKLCADQIEAEIDQMIAANSQATMTSLVAEHQAISAEERSREVLEELIRSMDRGKNQ